jgi:HD-GYP domain-containing protein (c-di-GMP phosphodiesterase class II)
MALLREESGTAFDARCVEALERVLARERGSSLAVAV